MTIFSRTTSLVRPVSLAFVLVPLFCEQVASASESPTRLYFVLEDFEASDPREQFRDYVERYMEDVKAENFAERAAQRVPKAMRGKNNQPQGDTVFMRHAGLGLDPSDYEAAQFQAAILASDQADKLAFMRSLADETGGIVRYRALLEMLRILIRDGSNDFKRLGRLLEEAQSVPLPKEILRSDIAYLQAYLSLKKGNIRGALKEVEYSLELDPIFLNALYLKMEILDRRITHLNARSNQVRPCLNAVSAIMEAAYLSVGLQKSRVQMYYIAEWFNALPGSPNAARKFATGLALVASGRTDDAEEVLSGIAQDNRLPRACVAELASAAKALIRESKAERAVGEQSENLGHARPD